jgi:hypothetical protein
MQIFSGALVIRLKYFKQRPNRPGGYYWYHRRIPKELLHHFRGNYADEGWIQKALGTNDRDEAIRRHAVIHAEVEKELDLYRKADGAKVATKSTFETAVTTLTHLGLKPSDASTANPDRHPEEAKSHLLRFYDYLATKYGQAFYEAYEKPEREYFIRKLLDTADREAFLLLCGDSDKPNIYLSDAKTIYLNNHPKGALKKFQGPVDQAYDKAFSVIGDLPLTAIDRTKAQAIRDAMLNSGNKTTSVKRRIGVLCAMINAAIEEQISYALLLHGRLEAQRGPYSVTM